MPYAYANWNQQTTLTDQLTVLNQHITEVTEAVAGQPDVASDSKSVAFGSSNQYLSMLYAERDKLLRRGAGAVRGGRSLARVKRF